jgi:acetaldehyde dehydrogenase/alcohol dehydrogenase
VGLFLPYTIEFAAKEEPERFAELASFIGCSNEKGEKAAQALAKYIRDLCQNVGNPIKVAEIGIERKAYEAQLEKMVDDAFNDTQIITAVRSPSYEELRQLFLNAYDGQPIDF